jgi:hypothetical protein
MARQPPSGPGPPHYRGFTISLLNPPPHTHTHTQILVSAPLDEWSARRRDYLTTHDTHNRHIHDPGGIRIRNPSKRTAADPRLRPPGNRDRQNDGVYKSNIISCHLNHLLYLVSFILYPRYTFRIYVFPVAAELRAESSVCSSGTVSALSHCFQFCCRVQTALCSIVSAK